MGKNGDTKNMLHLAIDVIIQIAYVNALWIGFSLAGGVLFGIFPATMALYEVIRKWETEGFDQGEGTFVTFKKTFRNSFRKANLIGVVLIGTGGFLGLDLYIASGIDHAAGFVLTFIFSLLAVLYLLFLLFIFPTAVSFEKPLPGQMKDAMLIGLASIPYAFLNIAASAAVLLFLLFIMPAAALFFAIPLLALINMKIGRSAIQRAERKQEKWGLSKTAWKPVQEN
ncbi:YesL family protein [Alteribacillus sp. HJP-4]|uniref:YesL family protein n=1 Tax=Alteribacillus sp. HJP-4 TaxID=2775394 RepID=UPI0035CD09E3